MWEKREASSLGQIAKKKWLMEGDQYSKFFHSVVNQRMNRGRIDHMVLADGRILEGAETIHNKVADFFQNFLTESSMVSYTKTSHKCS